MMKRFSVVLGAAVLSACGGGDGNAAHNESTADHSKTVAEAKAAAVDPCSLITPLEVTTITGDAVQRTSRSGNSCKYHSDPDDGAETTISLTDGVKKIEIARKSMKLAGGIGKHVSGQGGAGADTGALLTAKAESPGIGDESLWGINGTIYARKGEAYVEVIAPLMHDPATFSGIPLIPAAKRREMAKAIAEKILTNIEKIQ